MLETIQNTALTKTDTNPKNKRPNSPSAEVKKLENKFEHMFAKAAQDKFKKDVTLAQTKDEKVKSKQDTKEVSKNTNADSTNIKEATTSETAKDTAANKSKQTKATTPLAPFDFKDKTNEDSKISLQEKIAKTKETAKAPDNNPLVEALSASSVATKDSKDNESKVSAPNVAQKSPKNVDKMALEDKNVTSDKTLPDTAKQSSKAETQSKETLVQKTPMPMPQRQNEEPKTLGEVEKIAKAQGLNPSKITLETEKQTDTPREIPASAKESIKYENENNTDRVAIVQRGTKKPKNITSKISQEYPTKKPDNDSSPSQSLLKDIPHFS